MVLLTDSSFTAAVSDTVEGNGVRDAGSRSLALQRTQRITLARVRIKLEYKRDKEQISIKCNRRPKTLLVEFTVESCECKLATLSPVLVLSHFHGLGCV